MRAMLLAVLTLAVACASPQQEAEQQAPTGSALAQLIRADLSQLERALAAPGVSPASLGEAADLGDGLIVRPLELIEDSRCPRNVECVWAGRLRLRADVSGVMRELTLGEALETPHGPVLLAVASPSPWAQWPAAEIARPEYRFGFRRP